MKKHRFTNKTRAFVFIAILATLIFGLSGMASTLEASDQFERDHFKQQCAIIAGLHLLSDLETISGAQWENHTASTGQVYDHAGWFVFQPSNSYALWYWIGNTSPGQPVKFWCRGYANDNGKVLVVAAGYQAAQQWSTVSPYWMGRYTDHWISEYHQLPSIIH